MPRRLLSYTPFRCINFDSNFNDDRIVQKIDKLSKTFLLIHLSIRSFSIADLLGMKPVEQLR
jgi:hypothetical protein